MTPRVVYRLPAFSVLECAACGLRYRTNRPSRKQIDWMYDREEYLNSRLFAGWEARMGPKSAEIRNFRQGLRRLSQFGAQGSLLDVGCGRGLFLKAAQENGWRVAGVEVSRYASEFGRRNLGLEILTGTLEEACFPDGSFDAVTLWDCLEHLEDPLLALGEANRILRQHGLCLVMTPNIDSLIHQFGALLYSLSQRTFQKLIELLYDTHHNYFFSEKHLLLMLSRAGFSAVLSVDRFAAHISRWQTLPIPYWMELGANFLDRVARLCGWDYRILVCASRG